VILASGATTTTEWIGGAAILIVLGVLVGYLVLKAAERRRLRLAEATRIEAAVPVEYRFRPLASWQYVLGIVSLVLLPMLVAPLAGRVVAAFAPLVVVGPLVFAAARRQRAHREEVIASVRGRAASMNREELADLVISLEANHGEEEMRPLRDLLIQRGVS
jgi:hypothetical protein